MQSIKKNKFEKNIYRARQVPLAFEKLTTGPVKFLESPGLIR